MSSSTASSSTAESQSQSPSSSSPVTVIELEQRPQAGPLPKKRGEIGYTDGIHYQADSLIPPPPAVVLPERHPADRDAPPAADEPSFTPSSAPTSTTTPTTTSTPATSAVDASASMVTEDDSSSTTSLGKRRRICRRWRPKKIPVYFGIQLTTLLLFILQTIVLAGTIATWGISIQILTKGSISGKGGNSGDNNNNGDGNNNTAPAASSAIFVHVVFGIVLLGQLLFYERRIYRMRAERYAHVHPGEMLPTSRSRNQLLSDPYIAISPWNRPPLPTYAAALAQSGVGTGDVEDHLIAAPPPPAYGNTRGSRLILQGFLRDSLRAQRPASVHSAASRRSVQDTERSRPSSYVTVDEEWEIIQDADRARRLEETLSTLERTTSR